MATVIQRDEVQRLVAAGAQLLEVLPKEEYDKEHLVGAIGLPLDSFTRANVMRTVRRDAPVIVYCQDVT